MRTIAAFMTVALVVGIAAVFSQGEGVTQDGLSIGVDADPSGNTATGLAAIDQCVSVAKDDTFSVDIFITDVTNLLAWEVYFSFDGSIVNVTGLDVNMFLAAEAGSDVFDASESLPSGGGLYRLGAVDLGRPAAPHSGTGVLARLTLKAVGAGISPAIILTLDANNDGRPDLGTRLKDPQENLLGDTNGDEFFDGTVVNAQIAVDRACPPEVTSTPSASPAASPTSVSTTSVPPTTDTTTPGPTGTVAPPETATASPGPRETATPPRSPTPMVTATPSGSDGDSNWNSPAFVAAYVAAGALAVLAVGGLALMSTRRRSP